MPKYSVTDPSSGKTYTLEGEAPPSEQELDEIFASQAKAEGPSLGQMAAGAAAEVGIGASGTIAGAALAPVTFGLSYPALAFSSGFGGSLVAQEIEGQKDVSYGRALAAGLMNLIPGAALGKGAKVGTVLAKEAKKGALMGAGEATVTSLVDEQRAPTFEEVASRAAGGALGGAVVGGALKSGSDLVALAKPSELMEAIRDLSPTAQRLIASTVPSRITGPEIRNVVIEGKNAALSTTELAGRVGRRIGQVIEQQNDPNAARQALNDYLDGNVPTLPSYLQPLTGDVDIAKEKIKELQTTLLANGQAGYTKLSPEMEKKISDSIQSGNYLTREFQFFTNSKYAPTPVQRQEAIDELAADYLSQAAAAGKTMSLTDARDRASRYLDDLGSKKHSVIKNDDFYPNAIDGFLKERKDLGPKLLSYLGEITDPGERLAGTLSRLGRGIYRDQTDGRILEILGKMGAVSSNADDAFNAELKLRKFTPTNKLYVPAPMQDALNEMYLSNGADDTSNALVRGIKDFWNTSVGLSKATKVLLNPPSYAVQAYSNTANLIGMGINPLRGLSRGLRIAFAEYGPLETITKNPVARKALLQDIADSTKYGIKGANVLESDVRDSLERGFFTETTQKALAPFSKAYTVADNAGRFVAWKGNQKAIDRIFPGSNPEAVKQFAANITNDTYQNYDRLSNFVKRLSRMGVMPQFAAFTMEFARNQYHQGVIIGQMLRGTFGMQQVTKTAATRSGTVSLTAPAPIPGLGTANIAAMRAEGLKRLAMLSSVYAAGYATISAINQDNNVDSAKEDALKRTALPDWEANNKLAYMLNEDGKSGKYFNPSYLVPHSLGLSAFEAGLSGQPIESVISFAADELVGEGSFVQRAVSAGLFNIDPKTKKPISYQTDKAKNVSERIAFALQDAFMPGAAREVERLGKAMRGDGPLKPEDVMKRQVGIRLNDFKIEDGAKMRIRTSVDNAKLALSDYNAARDYKQLAPSQLETVYQNANNARADALEKIAIHVQDLNTLGFNQDETIKLLKDAGLASKDILGVLTGTLDPIPRDKKVTATDLYSEISALPENQRLRAISQYSNNPTLYKGLMETYRQDKRLQARNVSSIDRLVMSLGIDDGERARFIKRSSQGMDQGQRSMYLNDLRAKKILTSKVEMQVMATP